MTAKKRSLRSVSWAKPLIKNSPGGDDAGILPNKKRRVNFDAAYA
ncbi:MAG: hypothetical protein WAP55_01200 [Minisyncoccia bacterium]